MNYHKVLIVILVVLACGCHQPLKNKKYYDLYIDSINNALRNAPITDDEIESLNKSRENLNALTVEEALDKIGPALDPWMPAWWILRNCQREEEECNEYATHGDSKKYPMGISPEAYQFAYKIIASPCFLYDEKKSSLVFNPDSCWFDMGELCTFYGYDKGIFTISLDDSYNEIKKYYKTADGHL